MATNDRFVVKHDEGWAVKKTRAGRSSSVHPTQKEAEKRAKELSITWEEAKSVSRAEGAPSGIPTQWGAAMIRVRRVTAATDLYRPHALERLLSACH